MRPNPIVLPRFSEEERLEIVRILSGRSTDPESQHRHRPGARVGYLLREYPALVPSAPAQLVLRNLADLMKPTTEPAEACNDWRVSVPVSKLAEWVHCTPRSVQTAIRQLTKEGWPLLISRPGKPGRASEYRFVQDPFAFADKLIAEAAAARQRRQPRAVKVQQVAFIAASEGAITAEEANGRAKVANRQRDWNLPAPDYEKAVKAAHKPWTPRAS